MRSVGNGGQARTRTQCLPPTLCSFPTPAVWGGKGCSPPSIPFPPAAVKTAERFSQLKQPLTDSCSHCGRHKVQMTPGYWGRQAKYVQAKRA